MVILGFWTSGQFFIHKAYVLLAFAGIWALMQGVRDIIIASACAASPADSVRARAGRGS